MLTLRIDGARIDDIASFYDEINRVFMIDVDWQLGPSLDALDDMLYGGYGVLREHAEATVVWTGHARAAQALGVAATRTYLLDKLAQPERFNAAVFRSRLEELDTDGAPTYFDTVLEVFRAHRGIDLVLE